MSAREFFKCVELIGHDMGKHLLLEAQKGSASINHPSEGCVIHCFKVSLRISLEPVVTATADIDVHACKPALH